MVSVPFLFGFIRGPVSQRRVEPFLIVTQFDPSGNIFDGPVACWIAGPVDTFLLESRIERLRPRIVITDTGPPDRSNDADLPSVGGELGRSVLGSAVGMKYRRLGCGVAVPDGHR